jgi:hypothetical protein
MYTHALNRGGRGVHSPVGPLSLVEDRKIDICCGLVSGYTASIATRIYCGLIAGYTA